MKRQVIYVYGKTMESIAERYLACNQALDNGKTLDVYMDIKVESGYRPGLEKLIKDIEGNDIDTIYLAGIQTITRKTIEFWEFNNYLDSKGVKLVDVHSLSNKQIPQDLLELSKLIDLWSDNVKKKYKV